MDNNLEDVVDSIVSSVAQDVATIMQTRKSLLTLSEHRILHRYKEIQEAAQTMKRALSDIESMMQR